MLDQCKSALARFLVRYLTRKARKNEPFSVNSSDSLASVLQLADVVLVEGNQRFSTAVKYLTQSTWSHAALYVGRVTIPGERQGDTPALIEADLRNGVITVPLSKYEGFNTRICRPIGLGSAARQRVAQFMFDSLGMNYDLKNVVDLARYLIPTPPVPNRFRRKMLALGSGDPTRAICSSRIAQAFQAVGYPILPRVEQFTKKECEHCRETIHEILHIRHHTLFTPRDFDVSPYFAVIKPTIEKGFEYQALTWSEEHAANTELADRNVVKA